jgi:hypothetical protein
METYTLIVWLMGNNPSADLRLTWSEMREEECQYWASELRKDPRRPPSHVSCEPQPPLKAINPVFRYWSQR